MDVNSANGAKIFTSNYSGSTADIREAGLTNIVNAFPNPFTDEIQITFAHSPEHQPKSITLFSATGEMIIKLKNPDYSVTHLDLGNLSSGMYLLVIESNTGIQSLKLSKE